MQLVERAYNLILKGISNIYNASWELCHIRKWYDDQMKTMVYSIAYLVVKSRAIDSLF